jgi:hypothetical protein
MMDMGRQLYNDAGAAGTLPPSSSNSNQFSPPSALTSNESLFVLDPDFSPFSADQYATEPFGIPVFAAPTSSDFASVIMDQYSANAQLNSSFMEGLHQASPGSFPSSGNAGFYAPADEWSGTSTNSMQEGGQPSNLSNKTSANSQVHASPANPFSVAGNNQSMASDERNPSLQSHYDNGARSGEDGFGF